MKVQRYFGLSLYTQSNKSQFNDNKPSQAQLNFIPGFPGVYNTYVLFAPVGEATNAVLFPKTVEVVVLSTVCVWPTIEPLMTDDFRGNLGNCADACTGRGENKGGYGYRVCGHECRHVEDPGTGCQIHFLDIININPPLPQFSSLERGRRGTG
jgi:hypothetical protein